MDTPVVYGKMYKMLVHQDPGLEYKMVYDKLRVVLWPEYAIYAVAQTNIGFDDEDYIALICNRFGLDPIETQIIKLETCLSCDALPPHHVELFEACYDIDEESGLVHITGWVRIVDGTLDIAPFDPFFEEHQLEKHAPAPEPVFKTAMYPFVPHLGASPVMKCVLYGHDNQRTYFFTGMHRDHASTRGNEPAIIAAIMQQEEITDPGHFIFFSVDLERHAWRHVQAQWSDGDHMLMVNCNDRVDPDGPVELRLQQELKKRTIVIRPRLRAPRRSET